MLYILATNDQSMVIENQSTTYMEFDAKISKT